VVATGAFPWRNNDADEVSIAVALGHHIHRIGGADSPYRGRPRLFDSTMCRRPPTTGARDKWSASGTAEPVAPFFAPFRLAAPVGSRSS